MDKVYQKYVVDFYEHGDKDLSSIDDISHTKTIAVDCKLFRFTFVESKSFS